MNLALDFYQKQSSLHRELLESVFAYCSLGEARYPECPEWKMLRELASLNRSQLSSLLTEEIKRPVSRDLTPTEEHDRQEWANVYAQNELS